LDKTIEIIKKKEKISASADEINSLFDWADNRLEKGITLHRNIRRIAQHLRVIAVCGGGTRFGGSAEIPLMADFLVGDSRSGMCFSEAMIGLIPGWGGVARTLVKAGLTNALYMAKASKEVKADQLKGAGIYNVVVEVPFSFPKRQKTGNPEADKASYLEALETHNDETGLLLLPQALALGICPKEGIPELHEKERLRLAKEEDILLEVARRKDPETYSSLWGESLKDVSEEIARLGRPLAPQSIEALDDLLKDYDLSVFDENEFVRREMEADAGLYRDTRFRAGLIATLEQRVADYREVS
jgi:enoyl-CoA hydratase/carnithine racemase